MQVVVQQPGGGGVTGGRVIGGGQGLGVLADQVMEPVPAGGGLGDQVLIVERLQAAARRPRQHAVQRGRGAGVDIGARVQAQAAEQAHPHQDQQDRRAASQANDCNPIMRGKCTKIGSPGEASAYRRYLPLYRPRSAATSYAESPVAVAVPISSAVRSSLR